MKDTIERWYAPTVRFCQVVEYNTEECTIKFEDGSELKNVKWSMLCLDQQEAMRTKRRLEC